MAKKKESAHDKEARRLMNRVKRYANMDVYPGDELQNIIDNIDNVSWQKLRAINDSTGKNSFNNLFEVETKTDEGVTTYESGKEAIKERRKEYNEARTEAANRMGFSTVGDVTKFSGTSRWFDFDVEEQRRHEREVEEAKYFEAPNLKEYRNFSDSMGQFIRGEIDRTDLTLPQWFDEDREDFRDFLPYGLYDTDLAQYQPTDAIEKSDLTEDFDEVELSDLSEDWYPDEDYNEYDDEYQPHQDTDEENQYNNQEYSEPDVYDSPEYTYPTNDFSQPGELPDEDWEGPNPKELRDLMEEEAAKRAIDPSYADEGSLAANFREAKELGFASVADYLDFMDKATPEQYSDLVFRSLDDIDSTFDPFQYVEMTDKIKERLEEVMEGFPTPGRKYLGKMINSYISRFGQDAVVRALAEAGKPVLDLMDGLAYYYGGGGTGGIGRAFGTLAKYLDKKLNGDDAGGELQEINEISEEIGNQDEYLVDEDYEDDFYGD